MAPAIAIATALLISACTKDKAGEDKTTESALPVEKNEISALYAGNILNPFDSFGYYHNEGLDHITHELSLSHDTSRKAKVMGTVSYIKWRFGIEVDDSVLEVTMSLTKRAGYTFTDAVGNAGDENVVAYLQELERIVTSKENYPDAPILYDAVKSKIERWEASVLTNQDLSYSDRQKLLQIGSVARFSSGYWIHVFNDYAATQRQGKMMPLGFWKDVLKVVAAVTADVAGAASGVFTESSVGAAVSQAVGCSADAVDMVTYCVPG